MAGRGSRFARPQNPEPKPLILLKGRPFFWWAVESIRRSAEIAEMVFVVLEEHVERYAIARQIQAAYPDARIVSIPEVTSGAAETAAIGVDRLQIDRPLAVNDCDHAFVANDLHSIMQRLTEDAHGALCCFHSKNLAYSYVRLDEEGSVIGTVEKSVVSHRAIAGCYLFKSAELFKHSYSQYASICPYDELYMSGIYNLMAAEGRKILTLDLDEHFAFGTPDEYDRLIASESTLFSWVK
jgi:NDP-sugar pyrophosphorylase family protein